MWNEAVNCREVIEHISAAVDGRLDPTTYGQFDDHIKKCSPCGNEFELERLTKRVVQNKLHFLSTPPPTSQRILSQIERAAVPNESSSRLTRMWEMPRLKPALAVVLVGVLAWALFVSLPVKTRHLHTSPDDSNIMHQSFNYYDAVVEGRMVPQVASSDPTKVKAYFASAVSYDVKVPRMRNCTLVGGFLSNYGGKDLAHVVYKYDDEIIYVHQVDMRTVLEGKTLTLPPHVLEQLLRTGWYTESRGHNCSIVMWIVDSTLCTVVADIDETQLVHYLTYAGD